VLEYNRLQEELAGRREHLVEGTRKGALERMGMSDRSEELRLEEMSGGEQTKVRIARIMIQAKEADLLILDEPTSHLDIEGVESLEDYLLRYQGAVIVVSHDRYFLDRVATCIWDLDKGVVREFKGNYSDFAQKKALEQEKLKAASEKNRRERERLLKVAEEQHLRNWYGTTHKTTIKRVERMGVVEGLEQEAGVREARPRVQVDQLRELRDRLLPLSRTLRGEAKRWMEELLGALDALLHALEERLRIDAAVQLAIEQLKRTLAAPPFGRPERRRRRFWE